MKSLILLFFTAFSFVALAYTDEYKKAEQQRKSFAASLRPGDCARSEFYFKARHTFENDRLIVDNVYFVLARDEKGLLIAQPHPECHQPSDLSAKCEYWFRSVEFNNLFLIHESDKKVKCPAGINKASMIKRLKKSHEAADFKVDQL